MDMSLARGTAFLMVADTGMVDLSIHGHTFAATIVHEFANFNEVLFFGV